MTYFVRRVPFKYLSSWLLLSTVHNCRAQTYADASNVYDIFQFVDPLIGTVNGGMSYVSCLELHPRLLY